MKFWHKTLIGSALGVILGLILPLNGGDTSSFFREISSILVSMGIYILLPLVLTQSIVASYELRQDGDFGRFALRSALYIVGTSLALSFIGGLSFVLFSTDPVPITTEDVNVSEPTNFFTALRTIFSGNLFQSISSGPGAIASIFLFACIFGYFIHAMRTSSKNLFDISDSASQILFRINGIIVNIIYIPLVVMSLSRILLIRATPNLDIFIQLIILLLVMTIIIVFVLYPLVIFVFGRRHNPFLWIRQMLGPALVGLFSGDGYLPLGSLIKAGSEELVLPKRIWQWFYSFASIIGRAGTAMVTTIAFLLILRSYSKLGISMLQFFSVVFGSTLISIILGSLPGGGIALSLVMLSGWYDQSMRVSFSILQPAAPILIAFAVFIDIASQAFIAYILSLKHERSSGLLHNRSLARFRDDFMIDEGKIK